MQGASGHPHGGHAPHFIRNALLVAMANTLMLADVQAACGPLAAGAYNVSQTCLPAAGVDASISTQTGTTITTTAGSSLNSRGNNANALTASAPTGHTSAPPAGIWTACCRSTASTSKPNPTTWPN
ncbi:hypothetical protein PS947_03666 [Pseudomonas fluorescens]|nr:hypothetical protein PS947_03666 [Pseudomonas fluorescens]